MRGDAGDHCLLALEGTRDADELLQQLVPMLLPGRDEALHILIGGSTPHRATFAAETGERRRIIGSVLRRNSTAPTMELPQTR